MMTYLRTLVLVGCVAAAAACSGDNGVKEPDGGGMVCKGNADCTESGKAVCDLDGTKVCVQCTPTMDSACLKDSKTPVCGGTTCRGCTSHSECPESDTCLPDGSCALESAVVYLTEGGNGTCTKASPCGKGADAMARIDVARPYLRVKGTINDGDMDIDNTVVTILGDATAVLKRMGTKIILDIKDTMTNDAIVPSVKVFDVQLVDATEQGIKVDDGASLELYRSKVLNSEFEGVSVVNGNALIDQSEISGTKTRYGVNLASGGLTISRSKISNNNSGAILIANGQKFTIRNSFIVGNTGSGGLNAPQPGAGSVLEFNTIADNTAGTGAAAAGGVYCDLDTFTFSNNIIYRNTGGPAPSFRQTFGNCVFTGSYVSPNDMADPNVLNFVKDTDPRDYHLTATSSPMVKNVGTAMCAGLVDYDGDSRPSGGACELGADEVKE